VDVTAARGAGRGSSFFNPLAGARVRHARDEAWWSYRD
jgi:hypothetical protein